MQGANNEMSMKKAMSLGQPNPGGPEKIDNLSKFIYNLVNQSLIEAKMSNFELDNRIKKICSD